MIRKTPADKDINIIEGEGELVAVTFRPKLTGSNHYHIKLDELDEVVVVNHFCFFYKEDGDWWPPYSIMEGFPEDKK